jgi:hypothetical protein
MPTTQSVPPGRLQFIGLAKLDGESLRIFKPILEANIDSILDKFYSHLATYPEIISKFQGVEGMRRIRQLQSAHWLKMFDGTFDQDYVRGVQEIGIAHERIGLAPHWYIGGYAIALSDLLKLVSNHYADDAEQAGHMSSAIVKAVMLDMDYLISIYIDSGKTVFAKQLVALADSFELSVMNVVNRLGDAAAAMKLSAMRSTLDAEASGSCTDNNCQRIHAPHVANGTAEPSNQADKSFHALAHAGQKISHVVKLINNIAGQSHLLALNPTGDSSSRAHRDTLPADEFSTKVTVSSDTAVDDEQTSEAVLHLAQELAQQASRLRSNVGAFIQNIRGGEASM